MTIDSAVLREIELELRAPFTTAGGSVHRRRILILELAADGQTGWAECPADGTAYSAPESADTAWRTMTHELLPFLLGTDVSGTDDLALDVGPHPMATSTVEAALWDLRALQLGVPLAEALGGRIRPVVARAVLGLADSPELMSRATRAVEAGYVALKAKISPDADPAAVTALRQEFPDLDLAVDANGSYDPADPAHLRALRALDGLSLSFIEQPFPAGQLAACAMLRDILATPVCLDEDVRTEDDASSVLTAGAADLLNLKSPRVGGHGTARRIIAAAAAAEVGVWWGGLLESGIGRAHAVAAATMVTHSALPADLSASDRYYVTDITEPWELRDGALTAPNRPGIGVAVDTDALNDLTIRAIQIEGGHTENR